MVNSTTKTVFLQADKVSASFRSYYDDERVMGKHFRISCEIDPMLSRQYTISNVMQPKTYNYYLHCLKDQVKFSKD